MTDIRAVLGDITGLEVDAVVNAANRHLQHGGGVALAISRAGGPIIQEASDAWVREHGPLRPGRAAVTPAGAMPARVVIHVAGPRWAPQQDNPGLLAGAVGAALDAAADLGCGSVALPAISAGIFGYPPTQATKVIADSVGAWCAARPGVLKSVLLVGYDETITEAFRRALQQAEPA